mmetsp:Transcript_92607/g.246006  ORF Transcript_92607/g.246006 Transcript_92607/m.246006 type:complete len:202 (-) Transcript_92607:341-946(-)
MTSRREVRITPRPHPARRGRSPALLPLPLRLLRCVGGVRLPLPLAGCRGGVGRCCSRGPLHTVHSSVPLAAGCARARWRARGHVIRLVHLPLPQDLRLQAVPREELRPETAFHLPVSLEVAQQSAAAGGAEALECLGQGHVNALPVADSGSHRDNLTAKGASVIRCCLLELLQHGVQRRSVAKRQRPHGRARGQSCLVRRQ